MAQSPAHQIIAPRILTDKSVDCDSLESIVASLCTRGMSDQQKAVALFGFTKRVIFHYPQRSERRFPGSTDSDLDTLRLINTYGYSFCSQQSLILVDLWTRAGLKSVVWGMPGHATAQVEYDGALHWFDPLIGAYIFQRDGHTIASLQDIARDPTLLTRDQAEKRSGPSFLACGHVLRDDAAVFCKHNPPYIQTCADLIDDPTFIAKYAADAKEVFSPNPPLYQSDLTLRAGESITFLWDFIPGQSNCKFLQPAESPSNNVVATELLPPHHICGADAEHRDPLNAPFWRPYEKTVCAVTTGRYQANGRHAYQPDLTHPLPPGDFEQNTFQFNADNKSFPALMVGNSKSATLIWRIKTPHVYTSADISIDFVRAAADDTTRLLLSTDSQKTWATLYDAGRAPAGPLKTNILVSDQLLGFRDVLFKIECAADHPNAGLNALRINAIFQHNMFARPFLVPGDNKITVTTASNEAMKDLPLNITWKWQEGQTMKADHRAIAASPFDYTLHVAGDELPRMRSLELSAK